MLEYLRMEGVGPADELEVELSRRLNFLTGDNGLGKTFLLDIAWWALTRTWARMPAAPTRGGATPAQAAISFRYQATPHDYATTSVFRREDQLWPVEDERPLSPGMVIYAQVDGGFSTWDPARNYWVAAAREGTRRPHAYRFTRDEVWDGLPLDAPRKLCNGLVHDWAAWQRGRGEAFQQLTAVLRRLSPSVDELLTPGALARVSLDDVRDHPTLAMPYGREVPLAYASAGIRRVVALAYLVVWSWQEHVHACKLLGAQPVRQITFLIDELEAHLHPQWQRRIVPALLDVMTALTGQQEVPTQLIAATHSPLVLASVEPHFDEARDSVFHLGFQAGQVALRRVHWAKQGDATGWLVSDVFGLRQARSVAAERAIEAASAWMRGDTDRLPEGLDSKEAIHQELERVLAGHDPFWPRWIVSCETDARAEP